MNNGQLTLESMSQAIWYNKWTLNKFSQYLHGDILEVGCGIGSFTNVLTKSGKVYAIDIDNLYVTKITTNTKAHVGFGDIERGSYFFKKRQFDVIVCLNVLEHIKDDIRALQNMYNLLKKDGHLILLVPSHDFLYGVIDESIGHFRRYDKKNLLKLLEKNKFHILNTKRINFLGAIGWYFAGKVLKNKIVSEKKLKLFNTIAPVMLRIEDHFEPPIGTSILTIAKK